MLSARKPPAKSKPGSSRKAMKHARRLACAVGAVGVGVLSLSVAHCTESIGLLTGSHWALSGLLAVGIDAGMVVSELAELASHGTKASARAAVNASPEPLSNWALSFGEDVLAVWLTWMATAHPLATTIIVAALVALSIFLLYHLFRFARRALQRLLAP